MTIFCVCNISWTQVHDYYQAYNYSPGLYSFSLLIYTWFIALLNELFSRDRILCSKTTDERWSNEDEIYKTALPHVLVGKNKGLKIKSKLLSKLLRIYPYFRLMASWVPPPMPCCHLVEGNTQFIWSCLSRILFQWRTSMYFYLRVVLENQKQAAAPICATKQRK